MASSGRYLIIFSAHLLMVLLNFLLLSFMSLLYILDSSHFSDILFINIFSHLVGFIFVWLCFSVSTYGTPRLVVFRAFGFLFRKYSFVGALWTTTILINIIDQMQGKLPHLLISFWPRLSFYLDQELFIITSCDLL